MKNTLQRAFTLIELLTVIAIIALLASLLMVRLVRARTAARSVQCLSNLRQWAVGMTEYLDDHEAVFPPEAVVDGINTWDMALNIADVWYNAVPLAVGIKPLSSYAGITADQAQFYAKSSLFHCPEAKFSDISLTYPNFSYAMNSKIIVPGKPIVLQGEIRDITRTPLFLDSGVPGESPIQGQKRYNGQPHAFANRFSARHGNSGNLVMADGHAASFRARKVVDMNPASPYYGKSIWPPVEVVWSSDPANNPNRGIPGPTTH